MDHKRKSTAYVGAFPNEQRAHVRFSFNVLLRIHCCAGDVIAAIVSLELIVGQSLESDFQLPSGPISVQAEVKNRRAFRYGFEFLPEQHERENHQTRLPRTRIGEGD
jgi:hypothetical protein